MKISPDQRFAVWFYAYFLALELLLGACAIAYRGPAYRLAEATMGINVASFLLSLSDFCLYSALLLCAIPMAIKYWPNQQKQSQFFSSIEAGSREISDQWNHREIHRRANLIDQATPAVGPDPRPRSRL